MEAKLAALGEKTPAIWLPPVLRQRLPRSVSSLKQESKKILNEEERIKAWEKSPRKEKTSRIDAEFPFKKYYSVAESLDRNSSSLLMQIRSGHFPLRDYLYKRKLTDSPYCQKCNLQRRETLDHLLKECPAYEPQRKTLRKSIYTRGIANPRKVLNDRDKALAVLEFVRSTGRWRSGTMRGAA